MRGEVRPEVNPPGSAASEGAGLPQEQPEPREPVRACRPKWANCPICNQRLSATNMARHIRRQHTGGGPKWREMLPGRRTST